MKKILVILILTCISSFTSAHKYEHLQINTYSANSHSSQSHTHTKPESESKHNHITFGFNEDHQPHLHSHEDMLFLKASGQKKTNNKTHVIQNTILDLSQLNIPINPKVYIQTTRYNSIFISRNRPLLI